MSPRSEQAELRDLQRKAYGRDGGLTDVEADRLRALEEIASTARIGPVPAASAASDVARGDDTTGVDERAGGGLRDSAGVAGDTEPEPEPVPQTEESDAAFPSDVADERAAAVTPRARLRSRGWFLAVAAVALVAIGLGAGWALFGVRAGGISLTEEQQQRRLELYEKEDFDEGSVIAAGQDDDALVWYGTKNGGEDVCIVLDVAEQSGGLNCQNGEDLTTFSLSAMTMVPGEGEEVPSGGVMAYMMYSTTGEPLVGIQRFDQSFGLIEQFDGDERERADELMDANPTNLTIVGYFRDEPVWLMDRWSGNGAETCLIIDGAGGHATCRPYEDAISDGIAVYVSDGEVVPGVEAEASTIWRVAVAYTRGQTPYLTIVSDPASVPADGDTWIDGSGDEFGGEQG